MDLHEIAASVAFFSTVSSLPPALLIPLKLLFLVAVVCASTRLYTTVRYRVGLMRYESAAEASTKPLLPPPIPYTIPIIGSALSFITPYPGEFWTQVFRSHPRETGSFKILLGGRTVSVLFSKSAVQALFNTRGVSRQGFSEEVLEKGFGVERYEVQRFYGVADSPDEKGSTPLQHQENMSHDFLLRADRVHELTAGFTRLMREQLADELCGGGDDIQEVGIYAWLRPLMFRASTMAFMGERIFEVYPEFGDDFFEFLGTWLGVFFGIPRCLIPDAYQIRAKTLDGLERWQTYLHDQCKGKPVDPGGDVEWEPLCGSRFYRARQQYYESRGNSIRARAGLDLGLVFALSGNAIPITGWMLMHILSSGGDKPLLGRIMAELEGAKCEGGTFDIPTLLSLPLLQSVFHEVLRLYVDVFISRTSKEDLTLPLDDGKRQLLLKKNGIVLMPSWLGHRDETHWTDPPCDVFYADRFLKVDPQTGKEVFSTSGTAGKFFPFGAGKAMCPGRVFVKREVLSCVAMVLLTFEFEFVGFVDEQGKSKKDFPGLKKAYSGVGVVAADGDVKVRVRRREGSHA